MKLADTITVVLCLLCSYMPRRKFSPMKISGIWVGLCKRGPAPSKGNEYFSGGLRTRTPYLMVL